jgi:hypothetical protein
LLLVVFANRRLPNSFPQVKHKEGIFVQKREFTGVWIPKFIIDDEELSWTQRGLYAEIASFEVCRKSNIALGERMHLSPKMIRVHLKVLIDKGYVVRISFDGRARKISAITHIPTLQGRVVKNDHPAWSKMTTIDNSIDNIELPTVTAQSASAKGITNRKKENEEDEDNHLSDSFLVKTERTSVSDYTNSGSVVKKSTPEKTTKSLYYAVAKKYNLVIPNHAHIPKWCSDLEKAYGVPTATLYLERLLERDIDREQQTSEFVPQLTTAFDIMNKSGKIIQYFKRTKGQYTKGRTATPEYEAMMEAEAAEMRRKARNAE